MRQKNTSNALILLETDTAPPAPALAREPSSQEELAPAPDTHVSGGANSSGSNMRAIAIVHDVVELVPESTGATVPALRSRGKWHERFGTGR